MTWWVSVSEPAGEGARSVDDDPPVPEPLGALRDEAAPPTVRSFAPHRPRGRMPLCDGCGEAEVAFYCECCGQELCEDCWGAGDESVCGDCCAASGCKRPVEDVEVPSGLL